MALHNEFKVAVPVLSPNELYQKHQAKIDADSSGGQVLLDYMLAALNEVFTKLRVTGLEEIPSGSTNVHRELSSLLVAMLSRAKRGDTNANMRFSFEMIHDPGDKKRQVTVGISLVKANVSVVGVPPVDGIAGFLRERGHYAQERQVGRNQSDRVDHFTTGKFAQTETGELLAVIDNTRIYGEPGIDIRGVVVRPQHATKYTIEIGSGVEKKERIPGKIELYSSMHGVVKTRYDNTENLRAISVDGTLKLGEVGFRSGGNVMSRGEGGRGKAISVETAEFRFIPSAFETRTNGAIFVKETIQGKVVGANVTADMVNQAPGKVVIATDGAITINRSVQGGFLCAPEIVIGNGRAPATLLNSQLFVRNRFTSNSLLLVGNNLLILGNDAFREPATEGKCGISGQNLFAKRSQLLLVLKQKQLEIKEHSDAISKDLLSPIQKKIATGQLVSKEAIRRFLEETSALEKQFAGCSAEEEEAIRLRISNLFFDLGIENPLPLLRRFSQKKLLRGELTKLEEQLAAITQDIQVRMHIAECKDGSLLTVKCWEDELRIKGLGEEMRIERTVGDQQLYCGPTQDRTVLLSFDYEVGKLNWEVEADEVSGPAAPRLRR